MSNYKLAIFGGKKTRSTPMPFRQAFGKNEQKNLYETIQYYRKKRIDPKYKGKFENQLCRKFSSYMGGGMSVAVSTGTGSIFIALNSLSLPRGSEVIISPFFEPGPLSCLIFLGLKPVVADTKPGYFNTNIEEIKKKITKNTSCVILVHSAGEALDVIKITKELKKKNIKVIEDCSQASGAKINKTRVGSYGDISAISTMFSKTLTMSGSGGLVFTRNKKYYKPIIAYSDRGKPSWVKNYDSRDPSKYLYPALNWNSNEFSCSVALSSLSRLDETIKRRMNFIKKLSLSLKKYSDVCRAYDFRKGSSPYFLPIWVKTGKIKCKKIKFAEAIKKEGIDLNPNYKFLCSDWVWAKKYFKKKIHIPNAEKVRNNSFNLFLNENYGNKEVKDITKAILKVEKYFKK